MQRFIGSMALLAIAAVVSSQAQAGFLNVAPTVTNTSTGSNSRTDNRVLVGINWTFGSKIVPELVLGFRSMKIKSNGDAHGAGLDLTFPIAGGGITFDKIRVKGIDGRYDVQGELGFGYSVLTNGFLLTGGVQLPYVVGGVDYLQNGGWVPYIGINTQGRYKKPNQTTGHTLSCPTDYTLTAAGESDPQVDGMTCQYSGGPD